MQNQTLDGFVLIAVPSELVEETGILPNTLMQYSVEEGKLIIEPVGDAGPLICGGNCSECPVGNKETTLLEFLNNLSEEQQRAALIHLSVMWAQKAGGELGV